MPRRSDGEDPGLAVAEAFAEIGEARLRILRDETVVRDTTVQMAPEGADAETLGLGIAVELLVDGEPAYRDDVLR